MPLSAVVASDELMQWRSGGHGSTFGGNPVSCEASLATIELLEEGLIDNAAEMGEHLKSRLQALMEKHECIGDVRGLGLMLAVDLVKDRESREPDHELLQKVLYSAFEKGVAFLGCGASSVRIAPPLIITENEADIAVDVLDQTLGEL
jgi:4-aminobutyrate aminotransferase